MFEKCISPSTQINNTDAVVPYISSKHTHFTDHAIIFEECIKPYTLVNNIEAVAFSSAQNIHVSGAVPVFGESAEHYHKLTTLKSLTCA